MGIACCRPSTTESDLYPHEQDLYPPNISSGAASPQATTPASRSPMASSGGPLSTLERRDPNSRGRQLDKLYNQAGGLAREIGAARRGTNSAVLDDLQRQVADLQGDIATANQTANGRRTNDFQRQLNSLRQLFDERREAETDSVAMAYSGELSPVNPAYLRHYLGV